MPSKDASSPTAATFRFNRETNVVKVENIPEHVSLHEVLSLFTSMIGDVKSSRECDAPPGKSLEIRFLSRDATKKALCMSGYTVGGAPLAVSPVHAADDAASNRPKRPDDRRNLYVLGLPLTLTKSEFANIFSDCGTVSHCVILATVDNASRRRGFVVMSTHEEAKLAMSTLSRTQIKGHVLDISWAVVQRSHGFLDGGDRNVLEASSPDTPLDPLPTPSEATSLPAPISMPSNPSSLSLYPTAILLVANLPSALFSQVSDLEPLLYPYGKIKNLQILEPGKSGLSATVDRLLEHSQEEKESLSAVVEYISISSAQEAKECLQRQSYAMLTLKVEYVRPSPSSLSWGPSTTLPEGVHHPPGCHLDPYWPSFGLGVPQYLSPPFMFHPPPNVVPYYVPAAPMHYGFPAGSPLFPSHKNMDPYANPIAIHHPPFLAPWPQLESRSSSLDSRYYRL
ncbi:hypothetical protein HGRIS_011314 [Hohenbuehelia grisea]|uniref:RRM domain-containing protein n=2 Tax=Hohenbuehelia grisea TaxID=104357 RepID=A0ABR3JUX5_9AGAR